MPGSVANAAPTTVMPASLSRAFSHARAYPVVIQLDGPATTNLLRGEAVQAIASNPRVVQSAVMGASKSNAGRRQMAALQLSPGLLSA